MFHLNNYDFHLSYMRNKILYLQANLFKNNSLKLV